MFRTSYIHHKEGYIVHAVLYGMFSISLCQQSPILKDVLSTQPGRLLAKTQERHTI